MQPLARFAGSCARSFSTQGAGKPPVSVVHRLKNGQTVTVRRLEPHEAPKLRRYAEVPKQLFDVVGDEAAWDRSVSNHFFNARAPGRDALAALVKDQVVGTTEIDPEPEDFEPPIDAGFVAEQGLKLSQVCVSRMAVHPDFQNQGVGRALKRAQLIAAAQAGYRAVVSETSRAAVKRIVEAEGGVVQPGLGAVWTLLPVAASAPADASQDTNTEAGAGPH